MKITVNNVYRKFNRKFRKLRRKSYPYSTTLILKVLTAILFIYLAFDIVFWDMWTAQLLLKYRHKIELLEKYLEIQHEFQESNSCRERT